MAKLSEVRKAQNTALQQGIPVPRIVEDVLDLLQQLHTIEHMQDRGKIKEIGKRYGWKPPYE